jgi:hypothetical protein
VCTLAGTETQKVALESSIVSADVTVELLGESYLGIAVFVLRLVGAEGRFIPTPSDFDSRGKFGALPLLQAEGLGEPSPACNGPRLRRRLLPPN